MVLMACQACLDCLALAPLVPQVPLAPMGLLVILRHLDQARQARLGRRVPWEDRPQGRKDRRGLLARVPPDPSALPGLAGRQDLRGVPALMLLATCLARLGRMPLGLLVRRVRLVMSVILVPRASLARGDRGDLLARLAPSWPLCRWARWGGTRCAWDFP